MRATVQMASSRSCRLAPSCVRTAPIYVFQPRASGSLQSSARSRFNSVPPRRASIAFTRSAGCGFSSEFHCGMRIACETHYGDYLSDSSVMNGEALFDLLQLRKPAERRELLEARATIQNARDSAAALDLCQH